MILSSLLSMAARRDSTLLSLGPPPLARELESGDDEAGAEVGALPPAALAAAAALFLRMISAKPPPPPLEAGAPTPGGEDPPRSRTGLRPRGLPPAA